MPPACSGRDVVANSPSRHDALGIDLSIRCEAILTLRQRTTAAHFCSNTSGLELLDPHSESAWLRIRNTDRFAKE